MPAPGIGSPVTMVIDSLQDHLRRPERESGYIHRIRVSIKRLRAWLQLVRRDADFDWRACDRQLRDLARRLSPGRDAQVILQTLEQLERKAGWQSRREAIQVCRGWLRFDPPETEVDWPSLKSGLGTALEELRPRVMELDSADVVNRGLEKCYGRAVRKGRRAFSRAGTIEDLHRLRKWVKYLYYQLQFLDRGTGGVDADSRERLDRLGDRLGNLHDLDLVRQALAGIRDNERNAFAVRQVEQLIDQRQASLVASCRRLYGKVFRDEDYQRLLA